MKVGLILCAVLLVCSGIGGAAAAETYVYAAKFGTYGAGNGQLNIPSDVAIDSAGNIYIPDMSNNRIQKFTSSGAYLAQWPTGGFTFPQAAEVDRAGNVYEVETVGNKLQKFTSTGTFLASWGTSGSANGQLNAPSGVAVDAAGNVYVAEYQNQRVQKFSSTGTWLATIGGQGTADGKFTYPRGVAVDSSGNLYVADTGANRIQKFSPAGLFLAKWGTGGTGDGQLNMPWGLAFDSADNVFVSELAGHRVSKFAPDGTFLAKFGTYGAGDGQLNQPRGIAVDAAGNVLVAEQGNNRIQKFKRVVIPDAAFTATPVSGTAPLAVAFTDTSTGAPTTWAWTFGDGTTATVKNPSHTYTAAGTYTVALTATNADGSNTVTKTGLITVTASTPPVADFSASPLSGTAPLDVAFTDASTNAPTSWAWTFGDGGTADVQSPSHTYTAAGTYTVALTVTNADGTDTATKTGLITVTPRAPVANPDGYTTPEDRPLAVPAPGVLSNDGAVVASTSAAAVSNPAHGTLNLKADGSFTYVPSADWFGTDTFTYTAATGTASSTPATVTIEVTGVNDPPTAAFTYAPAAPTVADAVAFTDGSSDPDGTVAAWSWDFETDGTVDSTAQSPGHTYATAGSYTVTLTVTDDAGATATATRTVDVTLPPAPTVDLGGPYTGTEGSAVTLTAAVSSATPIAKYDWDLDGDLAFDDRTTATPSTEYTWGDVYAGAVGVRATDSHGQTGTDTASVAIANVAPAVSGVTVPTSPVAVGATVPASAGFTHPGTGAVTAIWAWDDGATTTGTIAAGSAAGTHAFTTPGVYLISVTVADDDGGSATAEATTFVVVYDPNGGFVTGGGWIDSPAGAYAPDPGLAGKATFGFVSKYQKGATVPTGQTQFEFHAADFTFHSTAYEWLVVAGTRAQYKGTGTVNGAGSYGFMLTATDGSPDRFRLKVWEIGTDTVVYDNQMGAGDTEAPMTAIGGGSIIVRAR